VFINRPKIDYDYYTKIDQNDIYVDYTNNRVKIINLNNVSLQSIKQIIHFASNRHLNKIICNCDINSFETLLNSGFQLEGKIDSYFKGKDAFCMSYFTIDNRKDYKNKEKENLFLLQSLNVKNTFVFKENSFKYNIRNATENDIDQLIALFSSIFVTYPSPVCDKKYLKQTMNKKVLYKVAVDNGKIIGVASADLDKKNLNAEITDCATYPDYRGKGVLSNIIYFLQLDLKKMGFISLYSLSRAINPSINFVLSKHNYNFRGKLINNCNICGGFENMNIWVKVIN